MSLSLFPVIDAKKTAENVDSFLTDDFKRALRMSGHSLVDLKSPALSSAPASSNGFNRVEDRLVAGITVEGIVQATRQSIYHCFKTSRLILVGLYIDELEPNKVAEKIQYEHSQYSVLRRKALNEFADRYEYWERKFDCYPIIDLHVYESENNRTNTGKTSEVTRKNLS